MKPELIKKLAIVGTIILLIILFKVFGLDKYLTLSYLKEQQAHFAQLYAENKLAVIGTYMLTKETTPLPASPEASYDCVGLISTRCYPSPEWRHTASVEYDSNEWWRMEVRWRFFQGVDYAGTIDTIAQAEMSKAQNYFDLNAVFGFMENSDITIGVNNFFSLSFQVLTPDKTTGENHNQ